MYTKLFKGGIMFIALLLVIFHGAWAQPQPVRISSGGDSVNYVDSVGQVWLTDRYFTGGEVRYTGDPIAGTSDRRLYATARAGLYTDFSYNIPVANGDYQLTLKFAEIQYNAAGYRVFNVKVNDALVLSNFDIMAEVPARAALDKTFNITVSNGNVKLEFIGVVHRAIVSAIQLVQVIPPPPPPPVEVTVSPTSVTLGPGGTQTFTATVTGTTETTVVWAVGEGTVVAGEYTAPATIETTHDTTVTATSVADPTKSASATVTLKAPVLVSVSPATVDLISGETATFVASVSNASNPAVVWSASLGTIDGAGVFTAPEVTSPTAVAITATSVEDPTAFGTAQAQVSPLPPPPPPPPPSIPVFQESGGQVVFEIERGTIINRAHQWLPAADLAGFSGNGYLIASPNTGTYYDTGYVGVAPEVQVQVNFQTPGTYYFWVRGYRPSPADDSVNVGIDGTAPDSGMRLSMFPDNAWGWSSTKMDNVGHNTIIVDGAGVHIINVWMREDGFPMDKVVLTTDPNYIPTGLGPAESPSEGGAPPTPNLSLSPTSLYFSTVVGSNPANQNVSIGSTAEALNWTAAKSQDWLTLSVVSGTTPSTLVVGVNAASLLGGVYTGTVTISSNQAGNTPRTVAVTLNVQGTVPPPPPPPGGNEWYVAPNGTPSGDGSQASPLDLDTVFSGSKPIAPGDTIWLRGGTYGGAIDKIWHSYLTGTAEAPIYVRPYPSERAIVIGGIATHTPHVWYWGFEVMNTKTDRFSSGAPECFDTYDNSVGVKIINMILHDCSQGLGFWRFAQDAEAHGNIIFYNGYQGTTRGHGHGIYTQNQYGKKLITDNIIFDQFGLGIQAYGSGAAYLINLEIDGNIIFNNGSLASGGPNVDNILVAVGSVPKDIVVTNNYTYHYNSEVDGYNRLGWQWSGLNDNIIARNNYWIGGEFMEVWNWNTIEFTNNVVYLPTLMMALKVMADQSTANYNWDHNQYFGSGTFRFQGANQSFSNWKANTGLDANSTFTLGMPTGLQVFVRPNRYEPGRGHIAIYNWDKLDNVNVDISSVVQVGAQYEIRDVQNFFGAPVVSGVYNGGTVSIPMTNTTKMAPVGRPAPPHTSPDFGAFVIFSR